MFSWIKPHKVTEWHPINTIPLDEVIILLCQDLDEMDHIFRSVARLYKEDGEYFWFTEDGRDLERVSFLGWQHLELKYSIPTLDELSKMSVQLD